MQDGEDVRVVLKRHDEAPQWRRTTIARVCLKRACSTADRQSCASCDRPQAVSAADVQRLLIELESALSARSYPPGERDMARSSPACGAHRVWSLISIDPNAASGG